MVQVQQQQQQQNNLPPKDHDQTDTVEDWDSKPLLTRENFHSDFDSKAYLKDFYSNVDDPAMEMVIRFLPGIVVRLPKLQTLLDFGSGPTIHVPVIFRNQVERIYCADYLPQNRLELQKWIDGTSDFSWAKTVQMIATSEGTDWGQVSQMEREAKDKVAGVLHCDCHTDPVIEASDRIQGSMGVVVTIFTLEYCCNTSDEYKAAVKRVVSLVKPGGYFIMGGILEETWCSFGGKKFSCLYITKEFMLNCLQEAGLIIDLETRNQTILHEINGMFLIAAKKDASK